MTDIPVTLITGGGSGIGAATARQLLDKGQRVTIVGRGQERLDGFAKEVGEPAELLTVQGDAGEWDVVQSAVAATLDRFGRLDAAVANAGFATHDDIAEGDPAGWREMVLANVLGPAPFWDEFGGLPDGLLLSADQVADSIVFALGQPSGVDVNTIIVRPIGQPA